MLGFISYLSLGSTIRFAQDAGAIAGDTSTATAIKNGGILNATLNSLQPNDLFIIENSSFAVMGGVQVANLQSVTIQIDGTLLFSDDIKAWPTRSDGSVLEALLFTAPKNVTFTSSGTGTLDGQGGKWWGIPGIGYLIRTENRPRLLHVEGGTDLLVENLLFTRPPYWTTLFSGSEGLEIRNCEIDARRDTDDGHDIIDITAFNTDGFDVTGNNVWIHDCVVWNQVRILYGDWRGLIDVPHTSSPLHHPLACYGLFLPPPSSQDDCVAVKDGSSNMVIERLHASGLGLTIGSIGNSNVNNITFRHITMKNTVKGVYLKFRGGGNISNVLFENVTMETPSQWAVWIGPAQQSDSKDLCAPHPCSLCWPTLKTAQCNAPAAGQYTNITLRGITIDLKGKHAPGVILANASAPMRNIIFEDVVVHNPGSFPGSSDKNYYCEGVESGVATGKTTPVPSCFKDETDAALLRRHELLGVVEKVQE